jgi:hypothetical protein
MGLEICCNGFRDQMHSQSSFSGLLLFEQSEQAASSSISSSF